MPRKPSQTKTGGPGGSSKVTSSKNPLPRSDMDVSVMDTEPLEEAMSDDGESVLDDDESDGASVLDTEPMEQVSGDSGSEECLDVDLFSSVSESEDDSDANAEDEYVAPAIDITLAPVYEVKRIYSDLIDSCRGFEDNVCSEESDKILKNNITTSDTLFRQMETTLSQSMTESQSTQRSNAVGNSASEVYLACLHTKMCTNMLKHKAKNVGGVASSFKLDEFLNALRQGSLDQGGGYSVLVAARKLAFTHANVGHAAPKLQTLFGAVDKDEMLKDVEPELRKEKKARVVRKKDDNDSQDVTQTEVVNENVESGTQPSSDGPEALARSLLRAIKGRYKQEGGTPQSLLEITYADNLSEFISRVFGVAFIVRDGYVGVTIPDNTSEVEESSALRLNPEKPPDKNQPGNKIDRRQTIVSLSAEFLKKLRTSIIPDDDESE